MIGILDEPNDADDKERSRSRRDDALQLQDPLDFVLKASVCPCRSENSAMAGESDTEGEENGGLIVRALDVLLDLAITVIEEAHEVAVATVPDDHNAQFARTDILHQAGADLLALANAGKVAIRRSGK